MSGLLTGFEIKLVCDADEWRNFNVYIMAVGFAHSGERVSFDSMEDKVREINYGHTIPLPDGSHAKRAVRMTTEPCAYVELYVYAVANSLPASRVIRECPPFPVELEVRAGSKVLERKTYYVNQLGGLTIAGLRVGADDLPQ